MATWNDVKAQARDILGIDLTDADLLDTARSLGAVAAAAPRDLVDRIKQTMVDVRDIDDHGEAVERELDPQVWSINQPAFQEKLAALQRRISSKG